MTTVRDARYDLLFEPVQIGPVTARNRFFQVPHCNGMGYRDPSALAAMRGIKAEGGWAVIATEETEIHHSSDVAPYIEGRIWDDRDIPAHLLVTEAIHAHGFGRTLLSRGERDRLDGFAILRSKPIRRENVSGRAYIHALAVRPGADGPVVLDDLLRQVWASCVSLGMARVAAGLSGRYQSTLPLFLERGFRVMRAGIRMVRLSVSDVIFERSDAIHLSRWAG